MMMRMTPILVWSLLAPILVLAMVPVLEASEASRSPAAESRLSLAKAVQLALENSFALGAERARLAASRERHGAAQAEYRPQVTAALRATEFEAPMVITPIHGFTPGITPAVDSTLLQGSLDLSLLLYDGKARRFSISQARAQVGAAGHAVSEARQGVVAQAVHGYLHILGNDEVLQAHDLRLEALGSQAARVRDLFSVGRVAEVEVLRIAAAVAAAEAERVLLAAEQENAERDLARLLGLADTGLTDTGLAVARAPVEQLQRIALRHPELPSREELLAQARAAHPAIRQARAQLLATEAAVAIARSARKPRLTALANVTDFGSGQGDFTAEWWAGLRLAVPLYTGGRVGRKIRGAEAAHDEAGQRLRQIERRLAESLDHASAAWRAAVAREASLVAAVRGLAAVAESERLRLDNGVGTPADFLDAEADLLQAKANRALARNTMILARVDLAALLGALDLPWIEDHLPTAAISQP